MSIFKPWESKNPKKRENWIKNRFNYAKDNHEKILINLAQKDIDSNVRKAAVQRLFDRKALIDIASSNENSDIRIIAIQKIDDLEKLEYIKKNDIHIDIISAIEIRIEKLIGQKEEKQRKLENVKKKKEEINNQSGQTKQSRQTTIEEILKHKFGLTYIPGKGGNFQWKYDGSYESKFAQILNNPNTIISLLKKMKEKPFDKVCVFSTGQQNIIIVGWDNPSAVLTSINTQGVADLIIKLGKNNIVYEHHGAFIFNF